MLTFKPTSWVWTAAHTDTDYTVYYSTWWSEPRHVENIPKGIIGSKSGCLIYRKKGFFQRYISFSAMSVSTDVGLKCGMSALTVLGKTVASAAAKVGCNYGFLVEVVLVAE